VCLAHEQGLLSHPELNFFQYWALTYWIGFSRRQARKDRDTMLEIQCYNLFPDRWQQLYQGKIISQLAPPPPEIPVTEDDLDEIARWIDNMNAPRMMSGAECPDDLGAAEPRAEWGEWQ